MIYTIYDIETTGLIPEYHQILSFGYMRVNDKLEILESGTLYFYQDDWTISADSYRVHGLGAEFLNQYKKDFFKNIALMYSMLNNSCVIGKNNIRFDGPFVKRFIKRHTLALDDLRFLQEIDMEKEYGKVYRSETGSRGGTLTDYIEHLGYTQNDVKEVYESLPNKDNHAMHMHGALWDVVCTYLVLKHHVEKNGYKFD